MKMYRDYSMIQSNHLTSLLHNGCWTSCTPGKTSRYYKISIKPQTSGNANYVFNLTLSWTIFTTNNWSIQSKRTIKYFSYILSMSSLSSQLMYIRPASGHAYSVRFGYFRHIRLFPELWHFALTLHNSDHSGASFQFLL